jgi:hypothetical protein
MVARLRNARTYQPEIEVAELTSPDGAWMVVVRLRGMPHDHQRRVCADGGGVRLAERGQNEDGSFRVRVSFGDTAEYDLHVADPADQEREARLAWYFEEHPRYPFLDKDLETAVQEIIAYGQALFNQVLCGTAYHDYRRLRDRALTDAGPRSAGPQHCTGCTGKRCGTRTCPPRCRSGCRSPAGAQRPCTCTSAACTQSRTGPDNVSRRDRDPRPGHCAHGLGVGLASAEDRAAPAPRDRCCGQARTRSRSRTWCYSHRPSTRTTIKLPPQTHFLTVASTVAL